MTHLNQLLAVAKGTKTQAGKSLTQAYHQIQRAEPWSGIVRSYRPKNEDGDRYTGETKHVQVRAEDVVAGITEDVIRMIDVQATVDATNQRAQGTVSTEDGLLQLTGLPVATLLFLDKQLIDLQTFFSKMPTLDIADKWEYDSSVSAYRSTETETTKTKKIPRNHVLAAATDKHPAQVNVFTEDVVEGYWTTTKFSGAMESEDVKGIQYRIRLLLEAVKRATQAANEATVEDNLIGEALMDYIVGDVFEH